MGQDAGKVYEEAVGHSHGAAVAAVYQAGYQDGQEAGKVVTETVTLDPNPALQDQADKAAHDLIGAEAAFALLTDEVKRLTEENDSLKAANVSAHDGGYAAGVASTQQQVPVIPVVSYADAPSAAVAEVPTPSVTMETTATVPAGDAATAA